MSEEKFHVHLYLCFSFLKMSMLAVYCMLTAGRSQPLPVPATHANLSPAKVLRHDRRRAGWLVSAEGVARRGGAVRFIGRCQLKKTGRRSSEVPDTGIYFPPAWCIRNFTSGFQVGRRRTKKERGAVLGRFLSTEEMAAAEPADNSKDKN